MYVLIQEIENKMYTPLSCSNTIKVSAWGTYAEALTELERIREIQEEETQEEYKRGEKVYEWNYYIKRIRIPKIWTVTEGDSSSRKLFDSKNEAHKYMEKRVVEDGVIPLPLTLVEEEVH